MLDVFGAALVLLQLVHAAHVDALTHRGRLGSTGPHNQIGAPLNHALWLLAHLLLLLLL